MNPKNLGFEECDVPTFHINLDKETQTKESSIFGASKPSTTCVNALNSPPFKDIKSNNSIIKDEKSDTGSITVFEFNQVSKSDSPKSIRIIREIITEEIHKHPSNIFSDDGTSNRYRYCREVIQPYLKEYPSDCLSEEKLIQEAIDSANEEFPDYQPCYEIYKGDKDIKEKKGNSDTSFSFGSYPSKVDVATSCKNSKTSTYIMDPDESDEKLPKKDCFSKIPASTSNEKLKKKSSQSSESCSIKEPVTPVKPVVKQEVPSCDMLEKQGTKSSTTILKEEHKEKSLEDAHNATIATLKCALEDFACKIYNTTKDVVTVVKTESVRQFEKLKTESAKYSVEDIVGKVCDTTKAAVNVIKTESVKQFENLKTLRAKQAENFEKCKSDWTSTSSIKNSENKSCETVTTFSFFRKIEGKNSEKIDKDTESEAIKPGETFKDVVKDLDSKVSTISQKLSDNWPDALKPGNFNDNSSPYDIPAKKCERPPKQVNNIMTPEVPASSNVFSAIKSRFFALFSDTEKLVEILSTKSSSSSISCKEGDD